ncbi:MAG: hypothetical protein V2J25_18300, partial [Desulfatiglans sp.]|nr:hypothetical protein [Desulfatiglans sp.]
QELNKISPDDFFAERNYKHLAIVNVCHQGKDDSAFLTPRAHFIPYKGKAEGFLNRLKEISKNTQEDPLSSVLICNANGDYPKKLEELVQSGGIRNTFYLKGGLEAYRVFLRRQVDILRANGTKKIVKGCRTCP